MNSLGKLLVVLMLPITRVLAHESNGHMMDWGHMNYGYGGVIMWIILLGLIAIAVYFLVNGKKLIKTEEEIPFEILQRRYAKGEISKQEFERIKKDLL